MSTRRFIPALAAVLALAAPAGAATVTVQNHNDSGNGSLRKAIADANPNDEIHIPAGTYKLTSGQLDIGINLTLIGAGAVTTAGLISLGRSLPTIWHALIGGLRMKRGTAEGETVARTDRDVQPRERKPGVIGHSPEERALFE